jgi:hypothetical protein
MKAVIFLGPSMPVAEASSILDAVYLPPAGQGDFMTATIEHGPDVIGLIDGVFLQSLAVWHKEILFALERGILVYGASSIGALRAAETDAYGMRGIGEIYRMYSSGALEDDDEVALVHTEAEDGYRKLSEPMVNVRATIAAAVQAGVLDHAAGDAVLGIAKDVYFVDRTFPRILAGAADVMPAEQLAALDRFVAAHYVDLKRQDAEALLRTVASLNGTDETTDAAGNGDARFSFESTTHFETLYNRDRTVVRGGVRLPLEAIGNYVALHAEQFDDLNFHMLNRALVLVMADWLQIDASPEDVAAESARFRRRHDLATGEALDRWIAENDIDHDEFRELMTDRALCRRLHSWFLVASWLQRTTKLLLDELRVDGQYEQWADRAAAQERLLRRRWQDEYPELGRRPLHDLLEEHEEWTGRPAPADPVAWAQEAGFHSVDTLRIELARARAARLSLLELLAERREPGE